MDEKFKYYGGSLKNLIFKGRVVKNQYIGGNCLKKGAWTVLRFKGVLEKNAQCTI